MFAASVPTFGLGFDPHSLCGSLGVVRNLAMFTSQWLDELSDFGMGIPASDHAP
jgi:hypothetical protein